MPLKKSLRSWHLKWGVIRFTHLPSVEWKQDGDNNVVSKKDYKDWEPLLKDSENTAQSRTVLCFGFIPKHGELCMIVWRRM